MKISRLVEFFEDQNDGLSAKRIVFLVLAIGVMAAIVTVVLHGTDVNGTDFLKDAIGKVLEFEKWLGAFIASEPATKAINDRLSPGSKS